MLGDGYSSMRQLREHHLLANMSYVRAHRLGANVQLFANFLVDETQG